MRRAVTASEQQFEELLTGPTSAHWFGTDNRAAIPGPRLGGHAHLAEDGHRHAGVGLIIVLAIGARAASAASSRHVLMRFTDLMYAFRTCSRSSSCARLLSQRDWPISARATADSRACPARSSRSSSRSRWSVGDARAAVRGQMLRAAGRGIRARSAIHGRQHAAGGLQPHVAEHARAVIVAITFGVHYGLFCGSVPWFIGFGLPPPTASLGTLVAEGQRFVA